MDNKKIPTWLGTVIIIIFAATAGVFVWKVVKNQDAVKKPQNIIAQPKPVEINQAQQDQADVQRIMELMKNTKIYTDKMNGFEFKYPSSYSISTRPSNKNDYLINDTSIKNGSNLIAEINIIKWKGITIKEGTPATEYQKHSYNDWRYITDNFSTIQSGNCDNNVINHVPGPTIADKPKLCLIDKQKNYIKIETENSIIYYTKNMQITWESSPQNFNLIKEISSTFKIN